MGDNKKNIDFGNLMVIGIIGGVLSIILYFIYMGLALGSVFFAILIFILLVISAIMFIVGGIGIDVENKKEKEKHLKNINEFQNEYDEYIKKIGIEKSNIQATLIELNEYNYNSSIPQYLWVYNNELNMFPMSKYYKECCTSSTVKPSISKLHLKTIPVDKILYFEEIGELRKYTTVSGGGSSLKGALLGYIVADDVGAIIGSREPIKTEIVSKDDRRIELIYKNEKDEILNLEFKYDAYEVLKKLIPSKELRRIVGMNASNNINDITNVQQSKTIKEKLEQLNDLKKENLISNEEFLEQKKKILDSF